jgi:hypothetical protein
MWHPACFRGGFSAGGPSPSPRALALALSLCAWACAVPCAPPAPARPKMRPGRKPAAFPQAHVPTCLALCVQSAAKAQRAVGALGASHSHAPRSVTRSEAQDTNPNNASWLHHTHGHAAPAPARASLLRRWRAHAHLRPWERRL